MLQKLAAWWNKPSQWWQVWMPRSGWFGGIVCGVPVGLVIRWLA